MRKQGSFEFNGLTNRLRKWVNWTDRRKTTSSEGENSPPLASPPKKWCMFFCVFSSGKRDGAELDATTDYW